jgi:uncharacterized protein YceK
VSISGDYAIVGAKSEDHDTTGGAYLNSAGSAYIFKKSCATSGTDVQTACDSFTWIDGNIYVISNNTATFILTNVAGCDSIVTLDLTINNDHTTDVQTACDTYTWMDGITYLVSNNTATYTLTNVAGCDSIVTLDLTINSGSYLTTDVQTACDTYTWMDGITYIVSNDTATYILTNMAGCDSVVTLDLTIIGVSDITTALDGLTISANNASATYQWLDCNNSFAEILGETNQDYTPAEDGSYAVKLTEDGCVDTSACVIISTVGINASAKSPKKATPLIAAIAWRGTKLLKHRWPF